MRARLSLGVLLVPMCLVLVALATGIEARAQAVGESATLREVVGDVRFEMAACHNDLIGPQRAVAVYTSKAGYSEPGVADAVLDLALQYAWQNCPQHFLFVTGAELDGYRKDVSSVDVYLPDGAVAIHAEFYKGDVGNMPGQEYHWKEITYPSAAQRVAAAQQAEQAQVQAQNQEATQRRVTAWRSGWADFWDNVTKVIAACLGLYVLAWLYKRRNQIARWYYFTFHPHPAEDAINSAISTGRLLDGPQLAALLGESPPKNAVFRQVRFEQSRQLIAGLEVATQKRLRELEAQAKEQYTRAAAQQAQAALAQAAIALEQAKAMLNASKRNS